MPKNSRLGQEERDLLIELRAQGIALKSDVSDLKNDIKEIKDGVKVDIEFLKTEKVGRSEMVRINTEQMTINGDVETRLRFIERYLWAAVGVLIVAQALMGFYIAIHFH